MKYQATPSSIFIFISSSSTGELCSQPIRGNVRRTGRMFLEHVERILTLYYIHLTLKKDTYHLHKHFCVKMCIMCASHLNVGQVSHALFLTSRTTINRAYNHAVCAGMTWSKLCRLIITRCHMHPNLAVRTGTTCTVTLMLQRSQAPNP